MKIIVPMAGHGSRFANRGFTTPKPLIPVAGQPMVRWALKSVEDIPYSGIVFVILAEHDQRYGLSAALRAEFDPACEVITLPGVTEGQLCTVLAARDLIDANEDILIISSDTYIVSRLGQDIASRPADCAGIISVADMPGDRWSFARTDASGRVVEVAEKVRISDHASTGLYYFSNGHEFVEIGDAMIRAQEKTRGEFYVIPVYQKLIGRGRSVYISQAGQMWDMGTPEALAAFEAHLARLQER